MMTIGMVMAIAAGLALPGHLILVGNIINQFTYHGIVTSNSLNIPINTLTNNQTCDTELQNNPMLMINQTGQNSVNEVYFCSNSSSGQDIIIEILRYICDPDVILRKQIGLYSLYYVCLATGVLIAMFLATTLWNLSAYRQAQKLQIAFYRSILRQNIAWFDTTESGQLSTRLAE